MGLHSITPTHHDSPNGIFGDAHVCVRDMHPVRRYIAQTIVNINARCGHVLLQLDHLKSGPRRVLGRKVGSRWISRESEYLTWNSKNVYLRSAHPLS